MNRGIYEYYVQPDILAHHGILGQKWGVRRFQNPDGTLTEAGKKRARNDLEKNTTTNTRYYATVQRPNGTTYGLSVLKEPKEHIKPGETIVKESKSTEYHINSEKMKQSKSIKDLSKQLSKARDEMDKSFSKDILDYYDLSDSEKYKLAKQSVERMKKDGKDMGMWEDDEYAWAMTYDDQDNGYLGKYSKFGTYCENKNISKDDLKKAYDAYKDYEETRNKTINKFVDDVYSDVSIDDLDKRKSDYKFSLQYVVDLVNKNRAHDNLSWEMDSIIDDSYSFYNKK